MRVQEVVQADGRQPVEVTLGTCDPSDECAREAFRVSDRPSAPSFAACRSRMNASPSSAGPGGVPASQACAFGRADIVGSIDANGRSGGGRGTQHGPGDVRAGAVGCVGFGAASAGGVGPAWAACAVEEPPSGGVVSNAVDMAPDGSRAAVAVCQVPADGVPHVEVCSGMRARVAGSAGLSTFWRSGGRTPRRSSWTGHRRLCPSCPSW